MNYVRLSTLDKKLYRVHVNLYATQPDNHVLEVAEYLKRHAGLSDALRVATAGELRRRKLQISY